MISRIATFAHSSSLMTSALSLQAELAKAQQQQASSLKSEAFSGLNGDAGRLLSLQSQAARATSRAEAAGSAASMMEQAYSALGNISDLASTIRSELSSRMNGVSDVSGLSELASGWLSELSDILNTRYGDIYVFSGQASDAAAVDFSTLDLTAEVTSADYYKGSSAGSVFDMGDGLSTKLAPTADDQGFQDLVAALAKMSVATSTDELSAAYDLVTTAITRVASAQEALAARTGALGDYQERMTASADTLAALATEISGADLAEATIKVTNYQTQLETLYSTISALSKIRLLDYL